MTGPDGVIETVGTEDALGELVVAWKEAMTEVKQQEQRAHDLQRAIGTLMDTLSAEEREVAGVVVTRKGGVGYDQVSLKPLLELLSEEEHEAVLTRERPAPERRYNIAKVKILIKQGGEVRRVVEAAQYDQPPETRLKLVEEN